MSRPRSSAWRRSLAAPAALALALVLGACGNDRTIGSDEPAPQTLVASATYAGTHPDTDLQARLAGLQRAIDRLRSSTGSGWVGRQDDVTGYLGELTGGRYAADGAGAPSDTATAFLDEYAEELFGVPAAAVVVDADGETDAAGATVLKTTQELNGVPVLDGGLVMTVGGTSDEPRLNVVRGRVYPGLDVPTTPRVPPRLAKREVRRLTHGEVEGRPRLVVLPRGEGKLAWELNVFAAGTSDSGVQLSNGLYYLDAVSATLLEVRPTNAELASPSVFSKLLSRGPGATRVSRRLTRMLLADLPAPQGQPVDVTGKAPFLGQVTAEGLRTGQGVALIDTTTPSYSATTGRGGIYTFTADGSSSNSALPGRQYVEDSTQISDPDAIGAQKISRVVYDYYAGIGRNSWDGQGASMVSTVNFSDGQFCNAFFSSQLRQMVYGNPCKGDHGGDMQLVTLDVTGHEVTHGVTDSTAGLNYTGQSGALNESFSDYFGNVIGDHYYQRDSAALGEDACKTATGPQQLCSTNPSGQLATRYMLNGNTMDDYLNVLDPPFRWGVAVGRITDNGGVHLNSAIWNNALWTIRTQLGKVDNLPAFKSSLVHDFDLIVYYTLTHQLGPNSTMVDAANAVEDTAVKAGASAVIIRIAKEVFDQNDLCPGCYDPGPIAGDIVSNEPQSEVSPVVSGKNIAWINPVGGPGTPSVSNGVAANPMTYDLAWAGDNLVTTELTNSGEAIVLHQKGGRTTKLDDLTLSAFTAGLAGSEDGAAWWVGEKSTLSYVAANGKVSRVRINGLGGDNVTAMATGGGTVAFGTESGLVGYWKPATDDVQQIGSMNGPVFALAAHGNHVVAIDASQSVDAFDTSGRATHLSDFGFPFGAAMNADYAVFPVAVDSLPGGVNEALGGRMVDTDLYLYSFKTNKIYSALEERGQQGFPSMSGNRLVWQDGVFGGDDIMSVTLPSGL